MSNTANIKDAVYLIDDDSLLGWESLRTSWDYEGDGQGPKAPRQREYWLYYFFSDPRYMTLDNKAVMSCFGV